MEITHDSITEEAPPKEKASGEDSITEEAPSKVYVHGGPGMSAASHAMPELDQELLRGSAEDQR